MTYGYDYTYLIYVLPALILALIADAKVKSAFAKYKSVLSSRRITGAQAARLVLDANGLRHVPVGSVGGELSDYYDPTADAVYLSESVYSSTSVASIGVALHEVGHAIQHATGYRPIRIRNSVVPIANIGSRLSVPMIAIGLLLSQLAPFFSFLAVIGVAGFALTTLFHLLTLPVEFNASRRALATIREHNFLTEEETKGAKSVLTAAALTYIAGFAVSLGQLLRFITIVSENNRSRKR